MGAGRPRASALHSRGRRHPAARPRPPAASGEKAAAQGRLPGGHPEGLVTAFANIYRNYVSALVALKKRRRREYLRLPPRRGRRKRRALHPGRSGERCGRLEVGRSLIWPPKGQNMRQGPAAQKHPLRSLPQTSRHCFAALRRRTGQRPTPRRAGTRPPRASGIPSGPGASIELAPPGSAPRACVGEWDAVGGCFAIRGCVYIIRKRGHRGRAPERRQSLRPQRASGYIQTSGAIFASLA